MGLQNIVIFFSRRLKMYLARIGWYMFTVQFTVKCFHALQAQFLINQKSEKQVLWSTVWRCSLASLVTIEQKLWEEICFIRFTVFEKNRAMVCNESKWTKVSAVLG